MTDPRTDESEISRRATGFEPLALVELLLHRGYRPEEILFRSQPGTASPVSLVASVEFESAPIRHVVVTLNHGLLGPSSPLPSYFKQLLAHGDVDEASFLEFLRFYDHRILDELLKAASPERDERVFADFDGLKRSYLNLIGIRSISTLHWLFELAFPELDVRVERGPLSRDVPLAGTRLGVSRLGGDSVLGGQTRVAVPGFAVTIYCDEEHTDFGTPWVEEVRRRLDDVVFPAVIDAAPDLRVSVVLRSEKVWAQLRPTSYLGFDRLKGGQRRNRQVLVWNGQVLPGARCSRRDRVRTRALAEAATS